MQGAVGANGRVPLSRLELGDKEVEKCAKSFLKVLFKGKFKRKVKTWFKYGPTNDFKKSCGGEPQETGFLLQELLEFTLLVYILILHSAACKGLPSQHPEWVAWPFIPCPLEMPIPTVSQGPRVHTSVFKMQQLRGPWVDCQLSICLWAQVVISQSWD